MTPPDLTRAGSEVIDVPRLRRAQLLSQPTSNDPEPQHHTCQDQRDKEQPEEAGGTHQAGHDQHVRPHRQAAAMQQPHSEEQSDAERPENQKEHEVGCRRRVDILMRGCAVRGGLRLRARERSVRRSARGLRARYRQLGAAREQRMSDLSERDNQVHRETEIDRDPRCW